MNTSCKHCRKFFKRYSCAKVGYGGFDGECDCPKCQGYCTCTTEPTKQELDAELIKAMTMGD